ncbi:MAG: DUF6443 domain-containing protein, partial [Bacteroidota bacterium]
MKTYSSFFSSLLSISCMPALIVFFLIASPTAWGQPTNTLLGEVTMPTPNSAALGKYSDIPVSHFTGVPNISIPIFTVQDGPLSVPISLSYHASGVKVGEPASWVGLGWSLNAGGIISRTVQGTADEGFGTAAGWLNQPLTAPPPCNVPNTAYTDYMNDLALGNVDGEPDIFSFNVGGYSGKFYINSQGEAVMVPLQDIKVSWSQSGSSYWFKLNQFVLTMPDGSKYTFGTLSGTNQEAMELMWSGGQQTAAHSWYLRRIESADGLYYIDFDYAVEYYSYKSLKQRFGNAPVPQNSNDNWTESSVNGVRLTSIITSTGNQAVTFVPSTENREDLGSHTRSIYGKDVKWLERIDIQNGSRCKQFAFSYDYYEDMLHPQGGPEDKRLKLLEVQEKHCTDPTLVIPPYIFEYEDQLINEIPYLPNRLSRAIDHWGFFNGAHSNNYNSDRFNIPYIEDELVLPGIIPLPSVQQNAYPFYYQGGNTHIPYVYPGRANREPDTTFMKLGNIKKITYPTGGHHEFEFEANEYYETESIEHLLNKTPMSAIEKGCSQPPVAITESQSFVIRDQQHLDNMRFDVELNIQPNNPNCDGSTFTVVALHRADLSPAVVEVGFLAYNVNSQGGIGKKFSDIINNPTIPIVFDKPYKLVMMQPNTYKTPLTFKVYEVNTINAPGGNTVAGGLRVKRIMANDGQNVASDKTYEYQVPGSSTNQSSGILYQKPKYSFIKLQIIPQPQFYGCPITPSEIISTGATASIYALYADYSIVPLHSFEGHHIGYEFVTEEQLDNGSTQHRFYTEYTPYQIAENDDFDLYDTHPGQGIAFPIAPTKARVEAGNTYQVLVKDENGTIVETRTENSKTDDYYRQSDQFSSDIIIKSISIGTFKAANGYRIRTKPYRLASSATNRDGINQTTTFEYNPNYDDHLMARAFQTTNSNGDIYRTEYDYAPDLNSIYEVTAPGIGLLARHIINQPIETRQYVNGTQVGGNRIIYSFFNNFPYPKKYGNYENGWTNKAKVLSYQHGFPHEVEMTGWDKETYIFQNGLLRQRQFKNWIWSYDYDGSLMTRFTDVDGQQTEYLYDGLMRLEEIQGRNTNVRNLMSYYQDGTTNYINTEQLFNGLPTRQTRQYLDGLGRPVQTIAKGQSPTGNDIITIQQYDAIGRQPKAFLPYTHAGNGTFRSNAIAEQDAFYAFGGTYGSVSIGYNETRFDDSPLNRPVKQGQPGLIWRADGSHSINTTYRSNDSNDAVRLFAADGTSSNTYADDELYVTETEDENGHFTTTFTDKMDRTIMVERSGNRTYYAYDDKGNLTYVIPPDVSDYMLSSSDWNAAASGNQINKVYRYTYDDRNRIIKKKLPSKDEEEYRYDERDLLRFSRDGNLRAQGKWLFTKYDAYGRQVMTGYHDNSGIPSVIGTEDFETPSTSISDHYYTNLSEPTTGITMLSTHYYDDYDYNNDGSLTAGEAIVSWNIAIPSTLRTVGKPTATKLGILPTDGTTTPTGYLMSHQFYDEYGRGIYTYDENHMGGFTKLWTLLDIEDKVSSTRQVFTKSTGGITTVGITEAYAYDQAGRLLHTRHRMDTHPIWVYTAVNGYNERGLLSEKNLGANSFTGPFLQTVNYEYNIRNWLTAINDVDNPSAVPGANDDLFALRLRYEDAFQATAPFFGIAQYNGNISAMEWTTPSISGKGSYSCQYDNLDRLTAAYYNEVNASGGTSNVYQYNMVASYDAVGNMMQLRRWAPMGSNFTNIDNLHYRYNSSGQLSDLWEYADLTQGFKSTAVAQSYAYDDNGNMTRDNHKDMTVAYNHLNLPKKFTFDNGDWIAITYDAAGGKLKKATSAGQVHHYFGNIEFSADNTLEAIYHSEGRLVPGSPFFDYEYTLRDHLGNSRISFTDDNSDGVPEIIQENHYYPFGMKMDGPWAPQVGPTNRYQYNGKELNGEFGLDLYEYGFRWYDPVLGRFTGVDPIADDFAWVSVYNYAENSPVANIDLHGLQKVSIHSRSFIPYKTLGMFGEGGSFAGDNRGFGDKGNSRISAKIDLNLSGKGITKTNDDYAGADTYDSDGNHMVYSSAAGNSSLRDYHITDEKVAATDLEFHVFGNNDAIPGSPDIDVRGSMGVRVTDFEDGSSTIYMSGKIAGDKFPANETFLTD